MTSKDFKLGIKARDKVTGLEGIIIAKLIHLNGCIQYGIKPPVLEGKVIEATFVDSQQIEIIDEKSSEDFIQKKTGGTMPDTPKL